MYCIVVSTSSTGLFQFAKSMSLVYKNNLHVAAHNIRIGVVVQISFEGTLHKINLGFGVMSRFTSALLILFQTYRQL